MSYNPYLTSYLDNVKTRLFAHILTIQGQYHPQVINNLLADVIRARSYGRLYHVIRSHGLHAHDVYILQGFMDRLRHRHEFS